MDKTFILISIIVVGLFILRRWLKPVIKGKIGEKTVSGEIDRLPKDRYRVLNNVIIPTPNNSVQIDHIIVSVYGVFVIETKNMKGWILGGEHSEYWTQNIYGREYKMYNPILQNESHVKVLKRVLKEYAPLPILPIVAFSGSAEIKVTVEDACVIYWRQIPEIIRQFDESRLTWEQVNDIYQTIESVRLEPGRQSNKRHLKDIASSQEKKYSALSSGRCPRCGGNLVLRTGKYGQFYGCSNYPQCRFTINVN